MTHGEELASDVPQDSIVLTYLEGLLMHQAAEGAGTGVGKESAARDEEDRSLRAAARAFPACAGSGPALPGPGVLHLRKARLLQSSEDWDAAKRRRLSESLGSLSVKKEALLAGVVDGVPKGKQDSTLLASLLQSFSSRLQTVALSQQIRQSLKEQGYALGHEALKVEKDLRCYGVASSHLKTLLKKSKAKDPKPDTGLPDVAKNLIRDRFAESPHPLGQGGAKVVSEPLSCAARLQAVASMVEKRASPATSPKPSVACSQLALLLSSEAHLQQYSREHALKTQSANQVASERLAAMARLQENGPKEVGGFQLSKGVPGHLNGQARTSSGKLVASKSAPFPSPMGIVPSSPKNAGCKNSQERNSIKQAASNSLLLHLLKSQTIPTPLNGHSHSERGSGFEDSGTPTTIDEYSDNNPSFTDDSSGDESTCSDCVPIDLSCKHRMDKPEPDRPVSLENLTQSLLNTWDPKVPGMDLRDDQDTSKNAKLNSHQKVTLLQLLLGHKSEENPERGSPQKAQSDGRKFSGQTCARTSVIESPGAHRATPVSTPPLLAASKTESPINLSQHSLVIRWSSPPYACASQSEKPPNPAPSHLMDLTKSREAPGENPVPSEDAQNPATFSASKLLQNLAQCGLQSCGGDERRPGAQLGLNAGAAERLSSPLRSGRSAALEESKAFGSPAAGCEPRLSGSEIENLLERRTVLQLLLGNPNKGKSDPKEKVPSRDESAQEAGDRALGEQILMVKIKSEPCEDAHVQHASAHLSPEAECAPFSGAAPAGQRSAAALPAPEDFKSEPVSPQDFSFSRNGLLSRLLRQNQESYLPDDLDLASSPRSGELALLESKNLRVAPKKRKLYPEPLENPFKKMKHHAAEAAHGHGAPEALPGCLVNQAELKFSRHDLESKPPSGHGASGESEHRGWARESKSFNVLKQLLLSESCVRDLSPHRSSPAVESKKKGHKQGGGSKPEFGVSSLNGLMYGSPQPSGCVDHRTFPFAGVVKTPVSPPFPEPVGCGGSRPESGLLNGCSLPGDKRPIKWVIADVEKSEYEKDCPRLTKTNPILYYMLQKGGSSASRREARDKDVWRGPAAADCVSQVPVKEKLLPAADTQAAVFNLRSPYGSHVGGHPFCSPSADGDLCGPLGHVLTIKKESE